MSDSRDLTPRDTGMCLHGNFPDECDLCKAEKEVGMDDVREMEAGSSRSQGRVNLDSIASIRGANNENLGDQKYDGAQFANLRQEVAQRISELKKGVDTSTDDNEVANLETYLEILRLGDEFVHAKDPEAHVKKMAGEGKLRILDKYWKLPKSILALASKGLIDSVMWNLAEAVGHFTQADFPDVADQITREHDRKNSAWVEASKKRLGGVNVE